MTIEDRIRRLCTGHGPVMVVRSDICDTFTVWFFTHRQTGHTNETRDTLDAALAAAELRTFGAAFAEHEHKEG
jgi:hypothetical protein